jgi:hypothetical protein
MKSELTLDYRFFLPKQTNFLSLNKRKIIFSPIKNRPISMRKHLLTFIFLNVLTCLLSQNAFYDAKNLTQNIESIKAKGDTLKALRQRHPNYKTTDSERTKLREVETFAQFIVNPYDTTLNANLLNTNTIWQSLNQFDSITQAIRDTYDLKERIRGMGNADKNQTNGGLTQYSVLTNTLRTATGASATALPTTSLLSATQIIDGTALFLKERVKEELGLAFFNRMRRRMDDNDMLGRLFPTTHRLLRGVFALDNTIPSLNTLAINAFQNDMEAMPENIENTLLYASDFETIRHDRAFKYYIMPFNIVKHMRLGSHPAWALEDMRGRYFTDSTEIDRIIQMMVALNDNLRAADTANNKALKDDVLFITQKEWASLKSNPRGKNLFMGLMYQKNRDIFGFLEGKSYKQVGQAMNTLADNVDDYLAQLNNFDNTYEAIQKSSGRTTRDSLGLELGWALTQLVDRSHWLYFSLLEKNQQESAKKTYWGTYKPIAESTLKAMASLQRKNWAGVMLNSYQILRGLSGIKSWKEGAAFRGEALQTFFFYGNFMTDVLTSTTSQDVATVLHRYAAPVGSYSVKRRAEFSLSLNAYPGLYGGWEKARDFEVPVGVARTSFVSGVTAPIGVALNFGGHGKRDNQSITAFLSIIDIGAVLSYRWANDRVQGLPEKVEWAQVMSPGAHLIYGLPELPIALSIGAQLQPRLRKIEPNGNDFKNGDFWRFSFGALTDITIFNLYSSGRKKTSKKND